MGFSFIKYNDRYPELYPPPIIKSENVAAGRDGEAMGLPSFPDLSRDPESLKYNMVIGTSSFFFLAVACPEFTEGPWGNESVDSFVIR